MTRIHVSAVIDAPVERVWAAIRDFNALPEWVPVVATSKIEEGLSADQVGCIRAFTMHNGGFLREQLLALSDREHSFTYSILESPMPVTDYIATVRLLPVTQDGRTFAQWTAEFDCPAEEAAALVDDIGNNVFRAGFLFLDRKLGDR